MRSLTLRFTIRDLFWLVVVVALAVGWWVDHAGVQRQRERLKMQEAEIQVKTEDLDQRRESVRQLLENLQSRPGK
jgi:hypothetical protein